MIVKDGGELLGVFGCPYNNCNNSIISVLKSSLDNVLDGFGWLFQWIKMINAQNDGSNM